MYSKVFSVLTLAVVAQSRDFFEGANKTEERIIYDEHLQASPAIWRQSVDLTINTTEHEVISKINITDLRPEKDGEILVTDGGVGQNNVSFTLKSPTILRGYDFHVQVFSIFDEHLLGSELEPKKPTLPSDNEKTTEKTKLKTEEESRITTEGATVTYPTQPPTTTDTMTIVTSKPTESPKSHGKPNNGNDEVKLPVPTVTEVFTEAPEREIPLKVNMPKVHS